MPTSACDSSEEQFWDDESEARSRVESLWVALHTFERAVDENISGIKAMAENIEQELSVFRATIRAAVSSSQHDAAIGEGNLSIREALEKCVKALAVRHDHEATNNLSGQMRTSEERDSEIHASRARGLSEALRAFVEAVDGELAKSSVVSEEHLRFKRIAARLGPETKNYADLLDAFNTNTNRLTSIRKNAGDWEQYLIALETGPVHTTLRPCRPDGL